MKDQYKRKFEINLLEFLKVNLTEIFIWWMFSKITQKFLWLLISCQIPKDILTQKIWYKLEKLNTMGKLTLKMFLMDMEFNFLITNWSKKVIGLKERLKDLDGK